MNVLGLIGVVVTLFGIALTRIAQDPALAAVGMIVVLGGVVLLATRLLAFLFGFG